MMRKGKSTRLIMIMMTNPLLPPLLSWLFSKTRRSTMNTMLMIKGICKTCHPHHWRPQTLNGWVAIVLIQHRVGQLERFLKSMEDFLQSTCSQLLAWDVMVNIVIIKPSCIVPSPPVMIFSLVGPQKPTGLAGSVRKDMHQDFVQRAI